MDYPAARQHMVESQIRPNRVTDSRIISAMGEIPRETFVPKPLLGVAYVDEVLALGNGRQLLAPMVLARLLQTAEIQSGDVVLDVGCGSGYSAAVLARLASIVVALECDPELAAIAARNVAELEIDNVAVVEGPLGDGWAKQGPYDVIVFDGAVNDVPLAVLDQLAEGGRLVAVMAGNGIGKATLVTRFGATLSRRQVFDAAAPCLPGFAAEPTFEL